MDADFLSQEHVSPGFEIVIADNELCPGSEGGIWNLWWNVQLSDDPTKWDNDIKTINKLQSKLNLTRGHRLIRAHIAEFCRVSPMFPESVNILCEEIGSGTLSKPYVLGCEGRNLLNTLSSHEFRQTYTQRTMIRESHIQALKRYLSGEEPIIPVDTKVNSILGTINEKKAEYAERLHRILEKAIQPTFSLQEIAQEIFKETPELGKKKIRPFNCLSCPMVKTGESGLTTCVCYEGLILDVCLIGLGRYDDWRIILKEHRRFQEEYILAYVSAVNSWLEERPMANILSKCSCKYLNNEIYEKIYENVNASLGSMDPAKTWLAACLLKTIKSNQRWHDTHEVIDDFPETASWLMNKI